MLAELTREEFMKRFEREVPSATSCFLDDFAACIAYLRRLIAHRRAIRTTNLLERPATVHRESISASDRYSDRK